MAYDQHLARHIINQSKGVPFVEKRMFAGVGYLFHANMACGVYKDDLIVRVDFALTLPPKEK